MRRVLAIFLPMLRIEIIRANGEDAKAPLALVVSFPGSPVQGEASLLGNTRIDEVSPEARALGIQRGSTIASARAKSNELNVRVVKLEEIERTLVCIAESLYGFGPTVSFDLTTNTVWVDITGATHLHQTESDPTGEHSLLAKVNTQVRAIGHACRVAIADGPVLAQALARYSKDPRTILSQTDPFPQIHALSLKALPLSSRSLQWLARLGLRTVGEVAEQPQRSLSLRLGKETPRLSPFLSGMDTSPLKPHEPAEIPEESATLEYGIETSDALLFVAKTLCDRLALRFKGRGIGTSSLQLIVKLDRAFAKEKPQSILELSVSAVLSESSDLLAILKARIESFQIEAPILEVTLRATQIVVQKAHALSLFTPETKGDRILPRLCAELEAELGPNTVGTLLLENRWMLEERSRLIPLHSLSATPAAPLLLPAPDSPVARLLSGSPEPTRALRTPISIHEPFEPFTFGRFESVEWWAPGSFRPRPTDHAIAWISSHQCVGFIEIDRRTKEPKVRGWMD